MALDQEKPRVPASAAAIQNSPGQPTTIIVQAPGGAFSRLKSWVLTTLLMSSLLANLVMYVEYGEYSGGGEGPHEKFYSGDRDATDKLAIIRVTGTIMPPFSDRVIKAIKKAKEDEHVKGVLLVVDSPGGTVTDSHQIYHRLKELSEKKPIVVSMGSLAASGGYFVAMGAGTKGKIFAEPTTWTGSIGVIIPHYEVTDVAEKVGFKALPLKTGEFKDSLSPFRAMTERDKVLWDNILKQSFDLFVQIIDDNRDTLNEEQVRELATGQIYTAQDAMKLKMIDAIGFEEEALEELKKTVNLPKVRVVMYQHPVGLLDPLLGSVKASDPAAQWRALLEMTVPRAMYYCSWGLPVLPGE
jgi:protease IV